MIRRLVILLTAILALVAFNWRVNPPVKEPVREWTIADSKAYAKDTMLAWGQNQYLCLEKLWTKESNWRPEAYNKIKVMGKHAGGIPQLLGMSPKLAPPLQIDRGFAYIMHRYGTPCMAWKFHQKRGWY
jgi:hypothetical protein